MDVQDYVKRLYQAFADAPRPERDEIAPHRCSECDEVVARLSPHLARDVPLGDMNWLWDTLPLLSPKAFRYYLPRFIECCVVTPECSVEAIINCNLAPAGELDVGARNRFAQFNDAERRALLEFVDYRIASADTEIDRTQLEDARLFWSASVVSDR